MLETTQLVAIGNDETANPTRLHAPEIAVRKKEEYLPFTVSVVREESRLQKAVTIRQSAYARHVPNLAIKLGSPEPNDRVDGSILLLAESKLDGAAVGTLRINTNRFTSLLIEGSVQ